MRLFLITVYGTVQGVGFRPFVYNLANFFDLKGVVFNSGFGVIIEIEGKEGNCLEFISKLQSQKPQNAVIKKIDYVESELKYFNSFEILESKNSEVVTNIPVDLSFCHECQSEIDDENARRFNYYFTNCINCGPRFSIIKEFPYDRKNSSMSSFLMCSECLSEYENRLDRRFHAQPNSCPNCTPKLNIYDNLGTLLVSGVEAIKVCAKFLHEGKIVAIKGVGGFHLCCDALNEVAINTLRERKNRKRKPFAVMFKDLNQIKEYAFVDEVEEKELLSNKKPIVLLKLKKNISDNLSFGIDLVGVMLPNSPLHYVLFKFLNTPIVVTSANISGEPLIKDSLELQKLSCVYDFVLDHERDIINSIDDSIVQVVEKEPFLLRGGRGYFPKTFFIDKHNTPKILGVGANQKSTISFAFNNQIITSHYLGNLKTLQSIEHFEISINRLLKFYNFKPDIVVCDKHKLYESAKWAKEHFENVLEIQHHYAHALSGIGEFDILEDVLAVIFDGTGFGDDGTIWGGEFFVCNRYSYKRVAHIKEFSLIAGDKSIKEPKIASLGVLFELFTTKELEVLNLACLKEFKDFELKTLHAMFKSGKNCIKSSSCGRVFDIVSAILGVNFLNSYEGESGLMLQNFHDNSILDYYHVDIVDGKIDFTNMYKQLVFEIDIKKGVSMFFNTIVEIIFTIQKEYSLPILIGGGVFQNRVILGLLIKRAKKDGVKLYIPKEYPLNDSSISFGQAVYAINL
ncbi:MAG: carbamoyltransferase HypF [Campylobacterales bacterium]|nr:carbamoyltransferase HypF [Campylobacterales bacterium]